MAQTPTDKDKNKAGVVKDQTKHFNELGPLEKIVALLFMNTAEAGGSSNPLGDMFARILGIDPGDYKNWFNQNMPGSRWRDNYDFNKFNMSRANEMVKTMSFGENQKAVLDTVPRAAQAAGISPALLEGLWGRESSFGSNRVSPSGCLGDFQFTKTTFASVIKKDGHTIAAQLAGQGQTMLADQIRYYAEGLRDGSIRSSDRTLQNLRNNPHVSTYAAAFYVRDVADHLNVDARQQQNWGAIYAGYNVGPGNAQRLLGPLAHQPNAGHYLGDSASWNPSFFRNGATGKQALHSYQRDIENFAGTAQALKNRYTGPEVPQQVAQVGATEGGVKGASLQEPWRSAAQNKGHAGATPAAPQEDRLRTPIQLAGNLPNNF